MTAACGVCVVRVARLAESVGWEKDLFLASSPPNKSVSFEDMPVTKSPSEMRRNLSHGLIIV